MAIRQSLAEFQGKHKVPSQFRQITAALIPGLKVKVEGEYNQDQKLVATSVKFSGGDLEKAQLAEASSRQHRKETEQHKAELEKQAAALKAQNEQLQLHEEQLAAHKAEIEAAVARFGDLAANEGDGTVSKLRASDGKTLGTFEAGASPYGVAFDGMNVWVANGVALAELRASDGKLLGYFNANGGSTGVTFDGANIWVAIGLGNQVLKF